MGAELPGEPAESGRDPEAILQLKSRLFTVWRQLPAEHQATIALVFVAELMAGEEGAWLREAIALQWPPHPDAYAEPAGIPPESQPPAVGESESSFAAWMRQADRFVHDTVGCSIHDLPDCDFYNMWRDGLPPSEAADTALAEAGFDPFA